MFPLDGRSLKVNFFTKKKKIYVSLCLPREIHNELILLNEFLLL